MSKLVRRDSIEAIVGTTRSKTKHYARAVSTADMVYILHSQQCLDSGRDLRECEFSLALDAHGISLVEWQGYEDKPVEVVAHSGWLVPAELVLKR